MCIAFQMKWWTGVPYSPYISSVVINQYIATITM